MKVDMKKKKKKKKRKKENAKNDFIGVFNETYLMIDRYIDSVWCLWKYAKSDA